MICPNCKTQNVEGAQFCRSCGTALTESFKWWERYGMVPVSMHKIMTSNGAIVISISLLIICLLGTAVGIFGMLESFHRYHSYIDSNGHWQSYRETDEYGVCLAIGVLCIVFIVAIFTYKYAMIKVFAENYRKKKGKLKDNDYIENYDSRAVHYVIIARGTALSHLFGLFDVQSIKIQLPFEYTELKWTEKGKLLSATKDGQKFIIDINGNKYE